MRVEVRGLRVALGAVFLAHGINHVFGGGRIPGTARWFESLGMKPGRVHAWVASLTEIASGAGLVLGFLTPFCGAGIVGVMTVAWIINHRKNGFCDRLRASEMSAVAMLETARPARIRVTGPPRAPASATTSSMATAAPASPPIGSASARI